MSLPLSFSFISRSPPPVSVVCLWIQLNTRYPFDVWRVGFRLCAFDYWSLGANRKTRRDLTRLNTRRIVNGKSCRQTLEGREAWRRRGRKNTMLSNYLRIFHDEVILSFQTLQFSRLLFSVKFSDSRKKINLSVRKVFLSVFL